MWMDVLDKRLSKFVRRYFVWMMLSDNNVLVYLGVHSVLV